MSGDKTLGTRLHYSLNLLSKVNLKSSISSYVNTLPDVYCEPTDFFGLFLIFRVLSTVF